MSGVSHFERRTARGADEDAVRERLVELLGHRDGAEDNLPKAHLERRRQRSTAARARAPRSRASEQDLGDGSVRPDAVPSRGRGEVGGDGSEDDV